MDLDESRFRTLFEHLKKCKPMAVPTFFPRCPDCGEIMSRSRPIPYHCTNKACDSYYKLMERDT